MRLPCTLLLILVCLAGCQPKQQDPVPNPLKAAFEVGRERVEVGETITMTNRSSHATRYAWSTGHQNSNDANPTFTFRSRGTHTITLTAFDAAGASSVTTRQLQVAERNITRVEVLKAPPAPSADLPGTAYGDHDLQVFFYPSGAPSPYASPFGGVVFIRVPMSTSTSPPVYYTPVVRKFTAASFPLTLEGCNQDPTVTWFNSYSSIYFSGSWRWVAMHYIDTRFGTYIADFGVDFATPPPTRQADGKGGYYDLQNAAGTFHMRIHYTTFL